MASARSGRRAVGMKSRYLPALRFHRLTPLYDPVVRWTTREAAVKEALIEQADVHTGHRVLDLGCGTGTLALRAKGRADGAEVVGLDPDPAVLEIARDKASRAGLHISFARGLADALPYEDRVFDRVLSSLLFHHLAREQKVRAFGEALRVLRPGGRLGVADWGAPGSALMRALFLPVRLLDGFETTEENVRGQLPVLAREAGFEGVEETASFPTVLGTLRLFTATAPPPRRREGGGSRTPA